MKKRGQSKRLVYTVFWDRLNLVWRVDDPLSHMMCWLQGENVGKAEFVEAVARKLQRQWRRNGVLSELVVKTKRGRIVKGSSGRRTFGQDPRRSRG